MQLSYSYWNGNAKLTHNIGVIITFGRQTKDCQTVKLKSPPNKLHIYTVSHNDAWMLLYTAPIIANDMH